MAKKKTMTEAQWEKCPDPARMLELLGDDLSERKLRLFACACCRRIWHQIEEYHGDYGLEGVEMFTRPVPVAEAFADGQASEDELSEASGWLADCGEWHSEGPEYAFMACGRNSEGLREVPALVVDHGSAGGVDLGKSEPKVQAALLRDVTGSPFRKVVFNPAWRTALVMRLAEAAYQERTPPEGALDAARLTVLADSLEEAGCTEQAVLDHLRGPGPHIRGCWALDLILVKK
jgi:hypothetical protein